MTINDYPAQVRAGIAAFEHRACDKSRFSKDEFAEHMSAIINNPTIAERFSRTHSQTQFDVFNCIVDGVDANEIGAHLETLELLGILETHPVNSRMMPKWKRDFLPKNATVKQCGRLEYTIQHALDTLHSAKLNAHSWSSFPLQLELSNADLIFCTSIFGMETTISAIEKWGTNLTSSNFSPFLQYIKRWDELKDLPIDWAMNLVMQTNQEVA